MAEPTPPLQETQAKHDLSFIDIGINLTDPVFRGLYHGKQSHEDDFDAMITRARAAGLKKLMITGSDVAESAHAVDLARKYPGFCYATIGVHPCAASVFDTHAGKDAGVLAELHALITAASTPSADTDASPLAAIGEFGLDYDRLPLCNAETQRRAFAAQLAHLVDTVYPDPSMPPPPLFLHSRAAHADFVAALQPHLARLPRRGVVHSFTGSVEEMRELVELGFAIGVNGCSLKTEESLAVVKEIPLDRMMLETDGPWCEVRPSSAGAKVLGEGGLALGIEGAKAVKKEKFVMGSMVKGRNEPCAIGIVARVVAKVKGVDVEEVARACWDVSVGMFGFGEEKR